MKKLTCIIMMIVALLGATTTAYAQPHIKGNVYGGGENAKVLGKKLDNGNWVADNDAAARATKVTVNNGEVLGDVYGAGMGVKTSEVAAPVTYDQVATVSGNTEVNLDANDAPHGEVGMVWGNVYGGAALAIVEGSTQVSIDGGKFASDVFGGGKGDVDGANITSANVKKNTEVTVTDGEIVWRKKLNSDQSDSIIWTAGTKDEFFDYEKNKYKTDHNIYAGGDIACVIGTWNNEGTALTDPLTGSSTLTMTRGLMGKDLLSSEEWKLAFAQHEDPHFFAFGGGYGIYTKAHKSEVKVVMPMMDDESASGGDQQLARPMQAPDNNTDLDLITDNYGVAWTTVLGVLGGGYNGHVETTNVLIADATYAHRVYGGGLGSYQGWVDAGRPGDPAAAAAAQGKVGTVGPLTGDPSPTVPVTHVTIAGGHIFGDVFGGGAGVSSRKIEGVMTDFTEIARVKGNTLVETSSYETYLKSIKTNDEITAFLASHPNKDAISDPDPKKQEAYPLKQRAQVFGNIYGGGDVANVSGSTNVNLFGGDVYGYTFGAGYGRLKTQAADYRTIGNVSGNSVILISDTVKWNGLVGDYMEAAYPPVAWNDIYGGGRNGVTNGNTTIWINGGKVGNNIFGGGLGHVNADNITSADVLGNTTVNINGGSYLWREIADIDGNRKTFIDDGHVTQSELLNRMGFEAKLEKVKAFFNYRTLRYTRDHSIYGGGNIACRVGTYDDDDLMDEATSGGKATVNMGHGLFDDTDISYIDDEENFNIATLCRYLACENSENNQFGVFGGGYGPNTKVSTTKLNLCMGQSLADQQKFGAYFAAIHAWYNGLSQEEKNTYYGGSVGENAYNRYFTARMAKSINIPNHTVLTAAGGGLAGYVAGNTDVTVTGHSGALRIFGGGIGMKPTAEQMAEYDNAETPEEAAAQAALLTYGQVGGNTKVDIQAGIIVRDVFGGGAGIESQRKGDDSYIDFPSMARVLGKTDVKVSGYTPGTLVFGKVFGGGDVANVGIEAGNTGATELIYGQIVAAPTGTTAYADPQTKVTIDGGCIFEEVFAGGSGRTKDICGDYTKLGGVYGNTQLIVNDSTYTAEQAAAANAVQNMVTGWNEKHAGDVIEPWLWNIVYGGGENGTIYGNTDVQIQGGNLGYDIFAGGLGNKTMTLNRRTGQEEEVLTSANVTQNTNVRIAGGKWCLSQSWNNTERRWNATTVENGRTYSPQYDPKATKFIIDHNVYGGGNVSCTVGTYNNEGAMTSGGKSYVYVTKGMLVGNTPLGHAYTGSVFEQDEWKNIYTKHASPHFSVFGAGYGFDTKVNETFVRVDMGTGSLKVEPSSSQWDDKDLSAIFVTKQTLMDVIGGGYEGGVNTTCNVNIDGYTFMRNAFGGAYYATVGNTVVNISRANMDNVFGGGMMGDVKDDVSVTIGSEGNDVAAKNANLIINEDVYGANDVAGYVGAMSGPNGEVYITENSQGVDLNLNGGHIHGNVYGGGNGNYLYKIDEDVSMVTAEDDADIGNDEHVTLYRVPLRASDFPSLMAMSDQQKMANVISYRPSAMKVDINFKGNSASDLLRVDGNIFGGGNSATINDFDGNDTGDDAKVHINVGSHIRVGGLFLGSDGEALFESKRGYMTYFPKVNNIRLYDPIDWSTPENQSIPIKFLPTPPKKRPEVYKNNLDLYFMPVEMSVMPEVTWGKLQQNNSVNVARKAGDDQRIDYQAVPESADGLQDAEIGTFCCGGNRGNMDTNTNFHVYFPAGLTITDKIVGGCNNANYTYNIPGTYDEETKTWETTEHVGGFLLGSHGVGTGRQPQIQLTMRNKFKITETQEIDGETYYAQKGNVFGGCYEKGIVRGDILVEVFSNMLMSGRDGSGNICGLDSVMLRRTTDKGFTVASVYGAGFGPETWVRGDTEVRLGDETVNSKSYDGDNGKYRMPSGASCNYIFGGGRQGNVIGNTNVQIKNGRVGGCVVGASYAGLLYGSAQTMVGFPEQYYRAKVSRSYDILRADEDLAHATYLGDNGKPLINKKVYYTNGDLITETTYQGIRDRIVENMRAEATRATFDKAAAIAEAEAELSNYFDVEHSIPEGNDWSKVDIQIDKAIYGGGYALATGAGSYTVLKYTKDNQFLYKDIKETYDFNKTPGWENDTLEFVKYGGNTFVIVGDVSGNYDALAQTGGSAENTRDHITLSSRQLKRLNMKIGDDLYGLFKELTVREANPGLHSEDEWNSTYLNEGKQPSGQFVKITYDASYTPEEKNNGNRYYEFTGEGGIYGDGRLSVSEGFRVCDAIGYGYNGTTPKAPKLMNCIHRFDIARFKDCCISLLGDRDYTSVEGSDANAVAYSIARVAEILMESSIPQNQDYQDPTAKHSRNYIGLSSSQFDLSAIKSNDIFSDDSDAALYHNKLGEVITTSMEIEGTTGKKFPALLSYYDVKKWYLSEYNTGIDESGYYDDGNAQVRNEMQFQLRNSATARNMFGIFSGYALNVHSTHYVSKTPESYYGPVVGVFEVDLIGTREGEAGGYAYAQNIHRENAKDAGGNEIEKDGKKVHSFLETSGNFVFPATSVRKVVDNCTPTLYNSDTRDDAEGHYWYVTGFKYYYNATITGYTYDGMTKFFDSDNTITKRLVLTGTKENQIVTLKNFHWLPRHAVEYYETAEEYNEAKGTSLTTEEFKALTDEEKIATDKQKSCDIEAKYLTKKDEGSYTGTLATNTANWESTTLTDNGKTNPYYNLSLSLSESGNYMEKTIGGDNLPYIKFLPQDNYTMSDGAEPYRIYQDQTNKADAEQAKMNIGATISNPMVGIRLTDCVNNNGKDNEGVSYFSKYLDDPCVAKIVLTTPAVNGNDERIWSAYSEVNPDVINSDERTGTNYTNDPYYVINADGDYVSITLEQARESVEKHISVFERQKDVYELVGDKSYNSSMTYYTLQDGVYTTATINNESDYNNQKSGLYYLKTPAAHEENYVYDITLTIMYIKGPSYDGHIDIKNCAMPGEMIRLSHENLTVESDEISLPHNGSFWTIGPGKKVLNDAEHPENGYHWELIDETGTLVREDATGQKFYYNNPATRNLYYPYNPHVNDPLDNYQKRAVSPIMRQGVYHDDISTDKPDYFVPAYYFMNGYVAQYSFTVNGIDEVFTTTIHPEDTLLVHNYHRMAKAADAVGFDNADDIKLGHAMKERSTIPDRRQLLDLTGLTPDTELYNLAVEHNENEERLQTAYAAEWPLIHKRPRVYIQDVDDLKAFADYLNRTADQTAEVEIRKKIEASGGKPEQPAVNMQYVQRYRTNNGQDVEFFLLNDIDLSKESWTAPNFKGTLHGNGHVISGLRSDASLFNTLSNDARIYNLGLSTGKIASTKGEAVYSCCYTYDTGEKNNGVAVHHVYRKDGTDFTGYDEDDWRTGRVAYDLNEYYLAERYDRNSDDDDDHDHVGYVEELYADGEYRFSRFSANVDASEYLRTKAEPNYAWGMVQAIVDDPASVSNHHYSYNGTTHVLSHKVDEARAFYTGSPATAFSEYRPLFEEAKHNTALDPAPTAKKNDYIFFGQTVDRDSYKNAAGTVGSNLPGVIDASSRTVTVGSYEGVTHNVSEQNNRVWRTFGYYQSKADDAFHFNKVAWALHPRLTAIDFTGQHENQHEWAAGTKDAVAGTNADIFYPKMMDMPDAMTSFSVLSNREYNADGTLRTGSNPYTNAAFGHVTQNLLVYNNGNPGSGEYVFTYRDVDNSQESAVIYHNIVYDNGSSTFSTDYMHLVDKQDFNAPFAFNVKTRAWYERYPQKYRNLVDKDDDGKVDYKSSSAWEGIVLPFTATKVTAEKNGEISHFYGEDERHHEYWLRGLKGVDGDKATFVRPAVSGDAYFTDIRQEPAAWTYTYPANTYFTDLYHYTQWYDTRDDEGDDDFGNHDHAWYAEAHEFTNYVPLTADVPYIVAFPGDDFYEFTMQSYYNSGYSLEPYRQKATFEKTGNTSIGVSDDSYTTSTADSKQHTGTFLHIDEGASFLGINAEGNAFDQNIAILPFRTYMAASDSSPARRYLIAEDGFSNDDDDDDEDLDVKPTLEVRIDGLEVTVSSSYPDSRILSVYTIGGQLVLHHEAQPGATHFRLPKSGAYIIGKRKYMVK